MRVLQSPSAIVSETVQKACSKCAQGPMDADRPGRPGNDHLYPGRCPCACHQGADTAPSQGQIDDIFSRADRRRLIIAAERLLAAIDYEPIRKAALACGQEIYERAADLKDAIVAAGDVDSLDIDLPIPFTVTEQGSAALVAALVDEDLVS